MTDYNDSIFKKDIDWLYETGITKSPADRYRPEDYVTRGEMAAFLHRTYDAIVPSEPEPPQPPPDPKPTPDPDPVPPGIGTRLDNVPGFNGNPIWGYRTDEELDAMPLYTGQVSFSDGKQHVIKDVKLDRQPSARGAGTTLILDNVAVVGGNKYYLVRGYDGGRVEIYNSHIGHKSFPAERGMAGVMEMQRSYVCAVEDGHGVHSGMRYSQNTIRDHDSPGLYDGGPNPHSDGCQALGPTNNVAIEDSRYEAYWAPWTPRSGVPTNAVAMIKTDRGPISNIMFNRCYLAGGGITMRFRDGGHGMVKNPTVANCVVDNRAAGPFMGRTWNVLDQRYDSTMRWVGNVDQDGKALPLEATG